MSAAGPIGTDDPPVGATGRTMPETDWLTGLASRAAFARQVNQADRDGDRFAIAVLCLGDFGVVNRVLGYDAGDDLLRSVGATLARQTSFTTVAGRLGGARFGLLDLQTATGSASGDQLDGWLAPIVDAVRSTVNDWAFEQHDFGGGSVVSPELLVGTAEGYGSSVWVDATVALEIAEGQRGRAGVVTYDATDRRVADRRSRDRTVDSVIDALARGQLTAIGCPITGTTPGWSGAGWWRLEAAKPDRRRTTTPVDRRALPDEIAAKLESWLVAEAVAVLGAAEGQIRLTVPFTGAMPIAAGPTGDHGTTLAGILRRSAVPPSRILLEIDESHALTLAVTAPGLGRQLRDLGTGVVLAGCEGGWRTVRAAADLPVAYLKPSTELIAAALDRDPAACQVLASIAGWAGDNDRELVAPMPVPSTPDLGIGFAEAERYLLLDALPGGPGAGGGQER